MQHNAQTGQRAQVTRRAKHTATGGLPHALPYPGGIAPNLLRGAAVGTMVTSAQLPCPQVRWNAVASGLVT